MREEDIKTKEDALEFLRENYKNGGTTKRLVSMIIHPLTIVTYDRVKDELVVEEHRKRRG